MQRGVARRQEGRMYAEGSGQTAGRQDACRSEWPYSMQRGVAGQQTSRMHAEGGDLTAGWQDPCRGE
jgi:hypothetical protein